MSGWVLIATVGPMRRQWGRVNLVYLLIKGDNPPLKKRYKMKTVKAMGHYVNEVAGWLDNSENLYAYKMGIVGAIVGKWEGGGGVANAIIKEWENEGDAGVITPDVTKFMAFLDGKECKKEMRKFYILCNDIWAEVRPNRGNLSDKSFGLLMYHVLLTDCINIIQHNESKANSD